MRFLAFALPLCLVTSFAHASPAFTFAQLLRRADTVAVVTLTHHDAKHVTLSQTTVVRGAFGKGIVLKVIGEIAPPADVTTFVVLSQLDPHIGAPEPVVRIGQGLEGQAGYLGFLLYPVRTIGGRAQIDPAFLIKADGAIAIDQLPAIAKRAPFRPIGG